MNSHVANDLQNQINSADKLNTYMQDWNKYYNKQDFNNMDKMYTKMEKELKNLIPLESIITQARQIENMHNLIKNNGRNFDISPYALELSGKLG